MTEEKTGQWGEKQSNIPKGKKEIKLLDKRDQCCTVRDVRNTKGSPLGGKSRVHLPSPGDVKKGSLKRPKKRKD